MAGFDFSTALRGAVSVGDAWQQGIEQRQQAENQQRILAAAEAKAQQDAEERARLTKANIAISEALRTKDYKNGAAFAYASGQAAIGDGLRQIHDSGFTHSKDANSTFANVAAGVAQLPYEQRRAAIASAAPRLAAMGIGQADIEAFDPTDQNLAALAGLDFTLKDRRDADQQDFANQTDRIDKMNPVVVGGSLVTRGGSELFRSPQFITAGTDQSVLQVGGQSSEGYTSNLSVGDTFARMIGVESNGQQFSKDGRPLTSSAGAIGIAQVMPGTAPEAARLAGLPYDENRYRTDPAYNRALGEAYFQEQVRRYGGDIIKATAAYNAGPGGVDRAVARATKRGGDWKQYLPSETQQYITKVHGRRGTTRPVTVVQQGVPKPTGANGAGGGKALNQGQTKRLEETGNTVRALDRLISTFDDKYAGNIFGGVENAAQSIYSGIGSEGQRDWWSAMGEMDNVARHQLFGAALTATEQQAWKATTVSPKMDPRIVRQNINRRREILRGAVDRLSRAMVAGGYNASQIGILVEDLGVDLPTAGSATPSAGAVAALRQNPRLRAQFDQKFGAGAAARVLGQ